MTTRNFERLRAAYSISAILLLNTLGLFVIANLAAALLIAFDSRATSAQPGPLRYHMAKLARVYPGWSEADIKDLLLETWSREYVYRPFVQHREAPRRGRYVNIDPAGFRVVEGQGPWPPAETAVNIFVFGGSTTFGYGLPDWQTVPSRMQRRLNAQCGRAVNVYNFGGGNFYSEQERALFENLLASGIQPDIATFLDGLNEWKEAPKFTGRLEYLMSESDTRLVLRALKTLPLFRWLSDLKNRDSESLSQAVEEADAELARRFVSRWIRNRRLVEAAGDAFDVETLFVWQPVPSYRYDLASHAFGDEARRSIRHDLVRSGYQQMDRWRIGLPAAQAATDFLWLADLQDGRLEPLYVDSAHYTAAFSDEIAQQIADTISLNLGCAATREQQND